MDVLVLIDKLDDLVHNARTPTHQVRVDKEEIYDILDQMRRHDPRGDQAGSLDRQGASGDVAEAEREAERIVKEARERQESLRGGDHQAGRAWRRGHHRGRSCPRARDPPRAEDYADEILNTLEVNLSKFIVRAAGTGAPGRQGRACRSVVTVEVLDTDITKLEVDAIANAANTALKHGGGVAGDLLARRRSGSSGGERFAGADRAGARRSRRPAVTCHASG